MSSAQEQPSIRPIQRDIPVLNEPLVDRSNLIETLVQVLSDETPVVFIEGDEGVGISTTLAQFARSRPESTFSLFIKPASRFAYNLDYLRLVLAEQLHW